MKNYDISIDSLVLEITRRCNMSCEHCMRGEAQNIDMDLSIIDKIFESGAQFSNVTFTGGDPSLYPEAIKHFVEALKFFGRSITYFYVKTNGKHESLEMAIALLELYNLCDEPEYCTLDVSRDQFHEGYEPLLYRGLRFYRMADEDKDHDYSNDQIIHEGNAYENGYGTNNPRPSALEFDVDEWGDEEHLRVEQVQVAANGNICGQCDISFEREDKETSGNILKEDLNTILIRAHEAQELTLAP